MYDNESHGEALRRGDLSGLILPSGFSSWILLTSRQFHGWRRGAQAGIDGEDSTKRLHRLWKIVSTDLQHAAL